MNTFFFGGGGGVGWGGVGHHSAYYNLYTNSPPKNPDFKISYLYKFITSAFPDEFYID